MATFNSQYIQKNFQYLQAQYAHKAALKEGIETALHVEQSLLSLQAV